MADTTPTVEYPLNILVVDDEINIRKTLTFCLEGEGHRVVAVSNPADESAHALPHAQTGLRTNSTRDRVDQEPAGTSRT